MKRHIENGGFVILAVVGAAVISGCGGPVQSTEATDTTDTQAQASQPVTAAATTEDNADAMSNRAEVLVSTGNGMEAIRKAADAGRYLFAFFWKEDDSQSVARRQTFDAFVGEVADRADSVAVNITDESQKEIVEKYGLDRAPMPLVLALAPNGAVTGGFPGEFGEPDLQGAFVSPGTARCIKPLQENKLVLLCIQNADTKSNQEAMKGVRDFKQDERFAEATEIVMLDPNDADEADFLADLDVSPKTGAAVTVLMAPPGAPIGMVEGPTTKEAFVDMLSRAQSGCCAGGACGPGGCGPSQ